MATAATVTIRLDGDSATLIRELNKANRSARSSFRQIQQDAERMAASLAIIATAAAAAFGALTRASFQSIDALAKTADRLGITTESLRTMQVAAHLAGVDTEQLNKALVKQQSAIVDARRGALTYVRAFDELGLKTADLLKLDADQQFTVIAEALNKVENVTRRNALAMDVWGARAVEMINFAQAAAGGLGEMRELLKDLNVTVSRFDASKIGDANDSVSLAKLAFEGLGNTIAVAVAPYVAQLAKDFTDAARETNGFKEQAASALSFVGAAVGFLGDGVRGVVLAFKTLAGAGLVAFGTVQGAVAGVGIVIHRVLIAPVATILRGWSLIASLLPGTLGKVGDEAAETFAKIGEARFLTEGWDDGLNQIRAGIELIGGSWDEALNTELPSAAIERWLQNALTAANAAAAGMTEALQKGAQGSGTVTADPVAVDTSTLLAQTQKAAEARLALERATTAEISRIVVTGEQSISAELGRLIEERARLLTDAKEREARAEAAAAGTDVTFDREREHAKNRLDVASDTVNKMLDMRRTVVDAGWFIDLKVDADTGALTGLQRELETTRARIAEVENRRLEVIASSTDLGALDAALDTLRRDLDAVEERRVMLAVDSSEYLAATDHAARLRTEITALEGRRVQVGAAISGLSEIEPQLNALRGQIVDLQSQKLELPVDSRAYTQAGEKIDSLKIEIAALDGRRVDLVADLDSSAARREIASLDAEIGELYARLARPPAIGALTVDFTGAVSALSQSSARQADLAQQSAEEIRRIVITGEQQISQDLANIIEARAQAMAAAEQRQAELRATLTGSTAVFDAEKALGEARVRLANETADALIAARARASEGGALALPTVDAGAIRAQTEAATEQYLAAWQLANQQRLEADLLLQQTLFANEGTAGQALIDLAAKQAREKVLAEFAARNAQLAELGQSDDPATRAAFEQAVQDETLAREAEFLNERLRLQQQFGSQYIQIQKAIASVFTDDWARAHKKGLQLTSVFASSAMRIVGALFAENKAVAAALAIINTAAAVTLALRTIPPPASFAVAAATAAEGLAQLMQIRSTTIGGGGSIGGGISAGGAVPTASPPAFDGGGAQGSQVTVVFEGDLYGFDEYTRSRIIDAIRDAVDGKDVVIFSGNSRQAREIREGG